MGRGMGKLILNGKNDEEMERNGTNGKEKRWEKDKAWKENDK